MPARAPAARRTLPILAAALLAACHPSSSATGTTATSVPDVGLAGAWAGTWTGLSEVYGTVTGDWEAEVVQQGAAVTGALYLGGDADCREASLSGLAGDDRVVRGGASRPPCAANRWALTALGLADRSVGGVWTQAGPDPEGPPTARGTFTGVQVGKVGGPRIRFFSPPSAPPGGLVTVVGSGFDAASEPVLVDVGGVPATPAAGPRAGTLTFRVPPGAGPGPLHVTAAAGTARSPRALETAPGSARPLVSASVPLGGGIPVAVAISPDGRRAYVQDRSAGTFLVDLRALQLLAPPRPNWSLQAAAASPDGRVVYLAGAGALVALDPGTALEVRRAPADSTADWLDPRGLAVTADGRRLVLTGARDGGTVSIHDAATLAPIAVVTCEAGATPGAVVAIPGRELAAVAVSRPWPAPGEVRLLDLAAPAFVAAVAVGPAPGDLAVTPDGRKLYVASGGEASVTVVDLERLVTRTVAVSRTAQAVAVAPGGEEVWVLGGGESGDPGLDVIDATVDAVARSTTLPQGLQPALVFAPDGRAAYALRGAQVPQASALVELGGPTALTLAKIGAGIGTVVSTPPGIECGPRCVARFEPDTLVTLVAVPDEHSTFDPSSGWTGACAGTGGAVRLSASTTCTVRFDLPAQGGGSGGGGSGGCTPADWWCVPGGTACFIATAAYGSPLADEVRTLRELRDRHLRTNAPGRAFVRAYQALSPPLAEYLRPRPALRAVVRAALWPVVELVKHPQKALATALGVVASLALWRSRRRRGKGDEP